MDSTGPGTGPLASLTYHIDPNATVFVARTRAVGCAGGPLRSFRLSLATAFANDAATLRWEETLPRSAYDIDVEAAVQRLLLEPSGEPDVEEALVIGRVVRGGNALWHVALLPSRPPSRPELRLIRSTTQSDAPGPWAKQSRSANYAISLALINDRRAHGKDFEWPSVPLGPDMSLQLVVSRLSTISPLADKGIARINALRGAFGLPALGHAAPVEPPVEQVAGAVPAAAAARAASRRGPGAGVAAAGAVPDVADILGREPALRFDFPAGLPWADMVRNADGQVEPVLSAGRLVRQRVAGDGACCFNAFAWFFFGRAGSAFT